MILMILMIYLSIQMYCTFSQQWRSEMIGRWSPAQRFIRWSWWGCWPGRPRHILRTQTRTLQGAFAGNKNHRGLYYIILYYIILYLYYIILYYIYIIFILYYIIFILYYIILYYIYIILYLYYIYIYIILYLYYIILYLYYIILYYIILYYIHILYTCIIYHYNITHIIYLWETMMSCRLSLEPLNRPRSAKSRAVEPWRDWAAVFGAARVEARDGKSDGSSFIRYMLERYDGFHLSTSFITKRPSDGWWFKHIWWLIHQKSI